MKEVYSIAINRPGMADLPELVKAESPEMAAEVVRVLLACRDTNLVTVTITVLRSVTQERAL